MEQQSIALRPDDIISESNIRFGLKKDRIQDLAESIKELGRVTTPLWVEPLAEIQNGAGYRLIAGNYRKAAVELLLKEGVEVEMPCIIVETSDRVNMLKNQLSENTDRENLSPMDKATAMKQLLDAGVSKIEVRTMFATPGGRKGGRKQPASNSFVNMHLSFLDFPKTIQNKIHSGPENGGIGVAAAYELTKVQPDKWETVLARAEEEYKKRVELDTKDEEKLLAQEKRDQEAEAKRRDTESALEKAKEQVTKASAEVDKAAEEAAELYKQTKKTIKAGDEEAQKQQQELQAKFKAAEERQKISEKAAKEAKALEDKLQAQLDKTMQLKKEREDKLKALKSGKAVGAAANKQGTGGTDIKKAAVAEGASTNYVPLTALEMRRLVDTKTPYPKIDVLFDILKRCFSGVITDGQMVSEVAYSVTGERKEIPDHLKPATVPDHLKGKKKR